MPMAEPGSSARAAGRREEGEESPRRWRRWRWPATSCWSPCLPWTAAHSPAVLPQPPPNPRATCACAHARRLLVALLLLPVVALLVAAHGCWAGGCTGVTRFQVQRQRNRRLVMQRLGRKAAAHGPRHKNSSAQTKRLPQAASVPHALREPQAALAGGGGPRGARVLGGGGGALARRLAWAGRRRPDPVCGRGRGLWRLRWNPDAELS